MSLADDEIEDEDIGPYWAEHFPRRHERSGSKVLCYVLVSILEDKAQSVLFRAADWSIKLHHTLATFGVPEDDFYELKKEKRQDWLAE
jgi:hypothetical protein